MLVKRFVVVLAFIAACGISSAAQEISDTHSIGAVRVTGTVRTASNIPVPAATLRIVQSSTGKAWISWTDENGKFEIPNLPFGHYRVEVSQLGFVPLTREVDLLGETIAVGGLSLDVGGLTPLVPSSSTMETATKSQAGTLLPEPANNETPPVPAPEKFTSQPAPATDPGGSNRVGGAGNGRGFHPLGLNGSGQDQTASNDETGEAEVNAPEQGVLGQSSTSDAFVMSGSVARAAGLDPSVAMMGGPGLGDAVPGALAGFADEGGGADGFGLPASLGGPRGPRDKRANYRVLEPGGSKGSNALKAGRTGFLGGKFKGLGGPKGVSALWGTDRVMRQHVNRVHYRFYDTYGNSGLNARPYSLTEANPAKIASWNERFGGNVGGPLKIPHLYNGTEKTFFFVNYELGWSRNPVDQFATVPTAPERSGNFCDRTAQPVQLFDPSSHAFWGCSIPSSVALNPAALGLLNFVPPANLPGFVNNFHLQTRLPGATNRVNVNVMHSLSAKLHLQVNYNLSDGHAHALNSFPGLESNVDTRGQSAQLGLTENWTRTFLHDSRLYFSRNRSQTLNQFAFNNNIAGALGIAGVSADPIDYGVPQLGFTNFSSVSDPVPSLRRNQTFRYVDTFSIMKSKHTVKTGFEIRRIATNVRTDPTPRGSFTFDGVLTAQPGSSGQPVSGTGFDQADFLLGLPQATTIRFGASSTYFRSWGYVAYAQDDWHIVPRFTLQYGVRYEAATPPVELNNRIANLHVTQNFTQAQCFTPVVTAATGACVGAGSLGLPASLLRGDYKNWSPRLGIAWQPPGSWFNGRNQTTVRAGYGIFYNGSIYGQLDSAMANQPPFAVAQTLETSAATPLTLQNGFPAAPPSVVANTVAVNPNYHVGYAQVWNLSIERQLLASTTMEVTYTGTKGTHLDRLLGFSRTPVPGQTGTVNNALGFTYDTDGADSDYYGLQVRVQRRFTKGLMVNGTYTFSKSFDDASSIGGGGQVIVQDNSDLAAERGLSSFDQRHQFRAGYMYELPFGDRKRFATHGWEKSVLGNWRFSGSFTARTGTPYTARMFSGACSVLGGTFAERANQVGDPNLPASERTIARWFNTAAFAVPTGCVGDAARNSITGPGSFQWNASLAKMIPLGSDGLRRLDMRLDTVNLTNHVNYTGLSTVVNSATFGSVTSAGAMRSMSITTRVSF